MMKAVIFDLDGTLLNRDVSIQKFIEYQYERLQLWLSHIPKESYIARFIELDNRGYVWKDAVYQQMVKEFEIIGITWEDLLEDYMNHFHKSCAPFPHLVWMLEELKRKSLKLGIITNGKGQFQMHSIKVLGIEGYFDTILISEWEGISKPDPRLFQKAMDHLNVLPNESVFVGDHPINDIQAARNIGMKTIWKKDVAYESVEADFVIEDLREILGIIETLQQQ
ncbi:MULTISPECIES: HAD family hydrolase [unclassified Geobacillus]|uniref:HAD family hydrolase n=1 Tax=unclassified Geobacillus TaxID=2642459 RepID=UPI000BE343AC|nr:MULTISPECIES: HAD family hydrolase [unclassified Geobacillus]PDM40769.1 L-2-haloalkanoic acid dehalogenase [Parageobacillus yumthangensis]RDV22844.1 HAD family hydrolase [Parageobacillus toebii]TXK91974.1 HAD family hydrolase [Parageobacillus sp. SY1]PUF89342.1 HAD-IIIA family hydrolase [Geobacillus sp. LYN3]TXK87341.1 HAD family hydrolase [Geobacillus sp. AYS3]